MNTTTAPTSALRVEYVNPVIVATQTVFETMLSCKPKRTDIIIKDTMTPKYELSAVIGVSGKTAGTIVLSISREAALEVLKRMVGIEASEIDAEVCDAVGEMTNMIAGQAKAQLEQWELSLSIPNMVTGKHHIIHYPSNVKPICIEFESEIGPFAIEVGFTQANQS